MLHSLTDGIEACVMHLRVMLRSTRSKLLTARYNGYIVPTQDKYKVSTPDFGDEYHTCKVHKQVSLTCGSYLVQLASLTYGPCT